MTENWRDKPESYWREKLTPEEYAVLREGATEAAGTGALCHVYEPGTYACAACGTELFEAGTKYESGTGWPSFFEPIAQERIEEVEDTSHGMVRTEARCNVCGSHLGHIFPDGPPPTGKRFCINSAALKFKKAESLPKQDT
jgi:peptide-methionine (R)-S-oxide reductase